MQCQKYINKNTGWLQCMRWPQPTSPTPPTSPTAAPVCGAHATLLPLCGRPRLPGKSFKPDSGPSDKNLELACTSRPGRYRIVLYAVPYSTQCRIVGRYVRILTSIDKKPQTNVNTCIFPKGHVNKKTKAPAALVSVANMGWGHQYYPNIDEYC